MDLSTLSRGRALAGALLLIVALFLGGRYVAGGGSAREQPTKAASAGELRAEPRPRLVVHVVGAVRRPGLYRLADLTLVNLAAPVSDGTQIVVPKRAPPAS